VIASRTSRGPARFGAIEWRLAGLLAAIGCALHLPWIARPFGTMEINAANYFGVFARNWAKHGFWRVRGTPLAPFELADPAHGQVYFNHPPGFAWLSSVFGTAEWQLRLPTVIGAILASIITFRLLLPRLGRWPGFIGGLSVLTVPMFTFFCVVSYENAVLPIGLMAWLALLRLDGTTGSRRAAWLVVLVGCSAIGPWMDWQYGFMVVAALPLVARRSLRDTVGSLVVPWGVSLAAVASVLSWGWWAAQSPALPPGTDFLEAMRASAQVAGVSGGPDLAEFASGALDQLVQGYSIPLLLVAAAGLWPLARYQPRWFLAALIAGALNPLLFPVHSATHVLFWAYCAPMIAGACAALMLAADALPRTGKHLLRAAVVAAVLWAGSASVDRLRTKDTSFFAEVGAALTGATDPTPARPDRRFYVASNFAHRYGYYVRSELVWPQPIDDPEVLAEYLAGPDIGFGIRYLLIGMEGSAAARMPKLVPARDLVGFLTKYPHRELSGLVGQTVQVPGYGLEARVAVAWLVTLRE